MSSFAVSAQPQNKVKASNPLQESVQSSNADPSIKLEDLQQKKEPAHVLIKRKSVKQPKVPDQEELDLPPIANNAVNFPKFVADTGFKVANGDQADPTQKGKKKKKKNRRATFKLGMEDTEALQDTLD